MLHLAATIISSRWQSPTKRLVQQTPATMDSQDCGRFPVPILMEGKKRVTALSERRRPRASNHEPTASAHQTVGESITPPGGGACQPFRQACPGPPSGVALYPGAIGKQRSNLEAIGTHAVRHMAGRLVAADAVLPRARSTHLRTLPYRCRGGMAGRTQLPGHCRSLGMRGLCHRRPTLATSHPCRTQRSPPRPCCASLRRTRSCGRMGHCERVSRSRTARTCSRGRTYDFAAVPACYDPCERAACFGTAPWPERSKSEGPRVVDRRSAALRSAVSTPSANPPRTGCRRARARSPRP